MSGRVSLDLSKAISKHLGVPLLDVDISNFANGEIHCRFGESVRGGDVFIIQSHAASQQNKTTSFSINDMILEHLIMVDTARRASAKRVTVVCPFFGYARQDRKATGREPISARLMADLFAKAGASRIVSVDLHSGQIQGYFDGPWDHLTAMPVLTNYLEQFRGNLAVVSPDAGRVRVAEMYSMALEAELAFVYKRRVKGQKNKSEALGIIGEVEGKTCAIVDDMIDTGGTIISAANKLLEAGAKEVFALATHGVFSGDSVKNFSDSKLSRVVVTDTLPSPQDKSFSKLEVLSVGQIIGDAIQAVFEDTSVSEIFNSQNQS